MSYDQVAHLRERLDAEHRAHLEEIEAHKVTKARLEPIEVAARALVDYGMGSPHTRSLPTSPEMVLGLFADLRAALAPPPPRPVEEAARCHHPVVMAESGLSLVGVCGKCGAGMHKAWSPTPSSDDPIRCATFAPGTISPAMRAAMDADRKAAEESALTGDYSEPAPANETPADYCAATACTARRVTGGGGYCDRHRALHRLEKARKP